MDDRTTAERAGLPANWTPVEAAPIIPGVQQGGSPPQPNAMKPFYSGSWPSSLQHDSTFVGTAYGSPSIPNYALMPISTALSSISSAASQSVAVSVQPTPTPTPDTNFYQTVQLAGLSLPQEERLNFLAPFTAVDNPGNISTDINFPNFVGDTGSGGVRGAVPAPPAGAAAAGLFLFANGTWALPAGSGGGGIPTVIYVNLAGQTASIAPTNILTAVPTVLYQFSYYLNCTTVGTAGSVSLTISWNDGSAESSTSIAIPLTQLGGTDGVVVVKATSGNPQYQTTVTGAAGSPQYSLDIRGVLMTGTVGSLFTTIALTPSGGGNFTVAHGLSAAPSLVQINMTSSGSIWFQTPGWDGTNIYLTASAGGVTGNAIVWY